MHPAQALPLTSRVAPRNNGCILLRPGLPTVCSCLPVLSLPHASTPAHAEVEYAYADAYIHIAGGVASEDWQSSDGASGSSSSGGIDSSSLGRQLSRRLAAVPAARRPPPLNLVRRKASSPPPTPVRRAASPPPRPRPPPPRPPPPSPVPRTTAAPPFVPNDPFYKEQWALVRVRAARCLVGCISLRAAGLVEQRALCSWQPQHCLTSARPGVACAAYGCRCVRRALLLPAALTPLGPAAHTTVGAVLCILRGCRARCVLPRPGAWPSQTRLLW